MLCHRNGFPKSHKLDFSVEPRQGKQFPGNTSHFQTLVKSVSNLSSGLRNTNSQQIN